MSCSPCVYLLEPICGTADIVMVLDSSSSIGIENWSQEKQFLVDLAAGLPIGKMDIKMGCVSYSWNGTKQWGIESK